MTYKVIHYLTPSGTDLFQDWVNSLKDTTVKVAVTARVSRVENGVFGDTKPSGDGVSELRIHVGPGYRVYYGVEGKKVVILLGGDKSTQASDIKRAKECWADWKRRK